MYAACVKLSINEDIFCNFDRHLFVSLLSSIDSFFAYFNFRILIKYQILFDI